MSLEGENRIYKLFEELVSIDSQSFHEREMADRLKRELVGLGFEVCVDDAGEIYGGNAGNIYAFLKGDLDGEPVLFSAHMDTVEPGLGKKAFIDENGRITSSGKTVLGGDDICGVVEILEGIRNVLEQGIPHRDIEVVFSIAEEAYTRGAAVLDYSRIKSKNAYVLDMSGSVGTAAIQAPSIISFEAEVKGKAAHAGFSPEDGINAIQIAASAISEIRQGHLDSETTLNIGQIMGGTATNIVSDSCIIRGEVRSFSHKRALDAVEHIKEVFEEKAKGSSAEVVFETDPHTVAYRISEDDEVVQDFKEACKRLDISSALVSTFGGSDNNQFVKNGLHGIVLSCGMREVHSVREYTYLQDLEMGVRLVEEIVNFRGYKSE